MDPFQIRQALREVRDLKKNILEKQLFKGYSGRARALGGIIALLFALLAEFTPIKNGVTTLFILWGTVFLLAILANYGALVLWMRHKKNRNPQNLSIVFEVFPVWVVGGVLTLALWSQSQYDLLYGSWMCLFGLAQSVSRSRLPKRITWIGIFYVLCGTVCLIFPSDIFFKPVIMGLVFFVGEISAGVILHANSDAVWQSPFFKF
ncbi:MAG: hypothetical protein O7C75_06300 [Verrucomicrobia bacterium]|nr:hypothetical protein [Verrucomicrobiota bacterium]